MSKDKDSSEKIAHLLMLLENARRIHKSCNEINTHKKMSYFTSNIETYLDGIVGVIETDIKNILLSEFFKGNVSIKKNSSEHSSEESLDVHDALVSSVYSSKFEKLDEL